MAYPWVNMVIKLSLSLVLGNSNLRTFFCGPPLFLPPQKQQTIIIDEHPPKLQSCDFTGTDRFIQLETKNLRVNKAHAYVVV